MLLYGLKESLTLLSPPDPPNRILFSNIMRLSGLGGGNQLQVGSLSMSRVQQVRMSNEERK